MKVKSAQVQIPITTEQIRIFACALLYHDPWNNAFKAIIEKQDIYFCPLNFDH